MKTTKTFLLIAILFVAVSSICEAQAYNAPAPALYSLFTAKTFATATTRTDTSATISTKYLRIVELATRTVGTDSLRLYMAVDKLVNGAWVLNSVRDTIKFGPATTADKSKGTYIMSGFSTSGLVGATQFRVRNTFVPFRTADSTGATSYTQTVIVR